MPDQTQKAKEIKQCHQKKWLEMSEVAAVGVGLVDGKKIGIIISVTEMTERVRKQIPTRIDEVPVKVEVTGEFKAQ